MISFSISSSGRTSPALGSVGSVPAAGSGAIGISLPETIAGAVEGPTINGSACSALADRVRMRGLREVGKAELIALAHDNGAVHRVLELADVAGPFQLRQMRHRLRR